LDRGGGPLGPRQLLASHRPALYHVLARLYDPFDCSQSVSEVAMRLRRIIPRFSLRTLVVFLLLVTSGVGLWWRWEPWLMVSEIPDVPNGFSKNGRYAVAFPGSAPPRCYDAGSGEFSHYSQAPSDTDTYDGERGTTQDGVYLKDGEIRSRRTGRKYAVAKAPRRIVGISPSGSMILVANDPLATWPSTTLCRRTRPEPWWGVFWLWEFWLTVALAGVFVWSVWRDRGALQRASLSLCQGERDRG